MSVAAEVAVASNMPSLKRPLPGDDEETTLAPTTPAESRQSSPGLTSSILSTPVDVATPKDTPTASTNATSIENSPSKTPLQSSAHTVSSSTALPLAQSSSAAPPAKRRRLTPAEKAEAEVAKAKKVQERAEAAARKEAEKLAKEEEKRKKAEEKEVKEKQKEEEKRAKDEKKKQEQEAKDAEKKRKAEERDAERALKEFKKQEKEKEAKLREASQMRLSVFFSVPKSSSPAAPIPKTFKASASPSKHTFIMKDEARRRSMSLDPVDFEPTSPTKSKPASNDDKQAKQTKGFLPFVLGKNMRIAPHNVFIPAEEELTRLNEAMDRFLEQPQEKPSPSMRERFAVFRTTRGFQPPNVAHVVQKLHGSCNAPIDLTSENTEKPEYVLKSIPMKYFFYAEDVRPPYRGTWTRIVDSKVARKMARNPLAQELPEVVYDYDSEAEWDDADEGEDIEIEDNEEEDDEEEEMEGFIDDDNAPQYLAKRGLPANDVQPVCSGLQWEDANGKLRSADPTFEDANFKEYEICFLLDPSPKTIDPFTTVYWDPEPKKVLFSQLPLTSSMAPPRLPLSDRTNGQATVQSTLVNGKVPKAAKVGPRLVPAEMLSAFRTAVDGSDMTKIALIEHLKKQFPKLGKAQITETLPLIAHRVGVKQAEKKWQLLADSMV